MAKPLFECVNEGVPGRLEQLFVDRLKLVRDGCQMAVVLLPKPLMRYYKDIKQVLTQTKPVGSQVVMMPTVMKNNMSIYSKILL